MPWRQTPSRKKKAVVFTNVTTNTYQGQLNAGFSKVCEIFKVCGIESLKYVREFHTPVCYCGDISTHRNVTLNETNCDWLFDMSVKRPHGWVLANESYYTFQTAEGLATQDCTLGYLESLASYNFACFSFHSKPNVAILRLSYRLSWKFILYSKQHNKQLNNTLLLYITR